MKNQLLTALGTLAVAMQAQAAFITGDIDFSGRVTFDTTSLATARSVNQFATAGGVVNSADVAGRTGDFATFVALGATASFPNVYTFNPSTPTNPLWTVGGFTFTLANSTIVNQSASFLNVVGSGTITGNGFQATPGLWSFSSTQSNGQTSPTFSFAANTTATDGVPDAGSALSL